MIIELGRRFACLMLIGMATLLLFSPEVRASGGRKKPNIVVILTDDQGWGDISVHGNKNVRTPNMDSLAKKGVTLERFFVQPVCSPTRAEILTGRYHFRSGVRGVSTGLERMNLGERTLADILRAAGYRTGLIGKWHNGSQWPYHPMARGFERFHGFTSGHWGEYFNPPLEDDGRPTRGKGFIADHLTSEAVEFVSHGRERPFFLFLAYNTPHSPFCVPDAYWDRFKNHPVPMRGKDGDKEDVAVTRCALAMVENLDDNIGRLLQTLERLGIADDTIVVFLSDNGPNSFRWNGGMRGRKGTVDEGGVRSPCFIRWTGRIPSGSNVAPIAGAIDLLPTLTSLAGVTVEKGRPLDGRDLSPLLRQTQTAKDWPDRELVATIGGKLSIRTQRFRLDATARLYDMLTDPGQTVDVEARHPDVAKKLKKAAADWRRELGGTKVDDRPYPVGHAEFPSTILPARDGVAHGNIRRSAPAPNCSYFTNWTSIDDAMTWNIAVDANGRYAVEILQTAVPEAVGAKIELTYKNASTSAKVEKAWNPPLNDREDRVPRKGESFMKEFQPLSMPPIRLQKGLGVLTLRATHIPRQTLIDVRAVRLTLLPDNKKPSR